MKTIPGDIGRYVRVDWPLALFAAAFLVLFAPLVTRNTDNPELLAAYSNDEPFLTMALEATLVPPYGNPGVYFDQTKPASTELPARWGEKRYYNITYYGGGLFLAAFPAYAGLRAVGLPPFPTGPIVLRIVTLLAGLLALVVLYNIGRERGSRLAGLLAAAFVASDVSFLYYANFIHPDTLQMVVGLTLLLVATAHARTGSLTTSPRSDFCAASSKARSRRSMDDPRGTRRGLAGHKSPRGRCTSGREATVQLHRDAELSALAGFFLTTPYAFIDTYYARSLRLAYNIVSTDSLQQEDPISLLTWTEDIYHYIGLLAAALVVLTVGRAVWSVFRRTSDHLLTLGVVLAMSQLVWYGIAGRLWHVVGYLILSFGVIALFAFETVLIGVRKLVSRAPRLRESARAQRVAWGSAVVVLCGAVALERWYTPVDYALELYASGRSSIRATNDWAIEQHVPATR